jgi:hypothetical protein
MGHHLDERSLSALHSALPVCAIYGSFADVDEPQNFSLESNGLLVKELQLA